MEAGSKPLLKTYHQFVEAFESWPVPNPSLRGFVQYLSVTSKTTEEPKSIYIPLASEHGHHCIKNLGHWQLLQGNVPGKCYTISHTLPPKLMKWHVSEATKKINPRDSRSPSETKHFRTPCQMTWPRQCAEGRLQNEDHRACGHRCTWGQPSSHLKQGQVSRHSPCPCPQWVCALLSRKCASEGRLMCRKKGKASRLARVKSQ
jgi:hypothetical protein